MHTCLNIGLLQDPQISWTHALRKIVVNCYRYHGREDLLPAFTEEEEKAIAQGTNPPSNSSNSTNVSNAVLHN